MIEILGIKKLTFYSFITGLLIIFSCKSKVKDIGNQVTLKRNPVINFQLLTTLPHDTNSFTEGLFMHDHILFESTGSPEQLPKTNSVYGILDTTNGKIIVKGSLDKEKYFGEGIAYLNDKIYQLTYEAKKGFIYDSKTFKKIGEFSYVNKEGWGLTTDGASLIMSDGSNKLYFLSPKNFSVEKTLVVFDINGAVENLNELEFINGYIYANLFTSSIVVKINPNNGQIVGEIDFSSLALEAKNLHKGSLEMNGIAYDSFSKNIFITGKMWPTLYKVFFKH